MEQSVCELAGLETWSVRGARPCAVTAVFLHGYAMHAADFTAFAHSLSIPGVDFLFPQGPLRVRGGGHAWWPIDPEVRALRLAQGARDLAQEFPDGRAGARGRIRDFLAAAGAAGAARPLLLAGFSQGGMLACDLVLMGAVPVAGLAMMSASLIAASEWNARGESLRGVRAFVSHGRGDGDLAFDAGEALRRFLDRHGARVTWVPFDGGHETPFAVWRQFRSFAHDVVRSTASTDKGNLHGTH